MISHLAKQRGNSIQRTFLRPFSLTLWVCAFVLGLACAAPLTSLFGPSVTFVPIVQGTP